MTISLHELTPSKGREKSRMRVGRGHGSGKGTTAGRGQKGQKARSGVGGLKRLGMRKTLLATPKNRGFQSLNAKPAIINLSDLAEQFKAGNTVNPKTLLEKELIDSKDHGVKILGSGEITFALTVQGCTISKSASEKIVAAGGKVII
ncbi:MAG: 50S ribosomal protein L15 [Patescibacteria group bacterium]|jgi:large subunit ribosomal protein L15